jgi:hypothetical protein
MNWRPFVFFTTLVCVAANPDAGATCILPANLRVNVGINISTNASRVSAPGEVTLTNIEGELCSFFTVSGTITILKDYGPTVATESGQGFGQWIHTTDSDAQLSHCYDSSATGEGYVYSGNSSGGTECWYGPPECDTCAHDVCETNPAACNNSPLVLRLDRGPYAMTGLDNGVRFDLNDDGAAEIVGWTKDDISEAFLVMDRNHNDRIDDGSELFGNATAGADGTRARNGYEALAVLDSNNDDVINRLDSSWSNLRLWVDGNHNGLSESVELLGLEEVGVLWLSFDYHAANRRDGHGNIFRYWSKFGTARGSRVYYDVYFVTTP